MTGEDFLFNGRYLSEFGFVMAKPSTEDETGLNREILKGSTNLHRAKAVHYGAVYNSTITLPLFIVKNPCDSLGEKISPIELRRLQAWLTSSKFPKPLHLMTKTGHMIEYYGIFSEIFPYSYNGLNGLNIKFTCDSPFAYDTKKMKVIGNNNSNGIVKNIYCDTDELNDFIYPVIEFMPKNAGQILFKNQTDENNIMTLNLSQKFSKVIIDCNLKRIMADGNHLSLDDVGWNIQHITDFNNVNTGVYKMYWFRLLPGKNIVNITGNGTFIITYKNLLKLGGLINV